MLKKIVFILVLIYSCDLQGQDEAHQTRIDSILTELELDLKPRQRIARQLKLVRYYKFSHPDVDSLIEHSLEIAEEYKLQFFVARSLKFRARYRMYMNERSDLIFNDIKRIEELSKVLKTKLLPSWVAQLYATYYTDTKELDKAKVYIDSLSYFINQNQFTDKGTFHTIKGMYYQASHDYTNAISQYNLALSKKYAGETFIYNNLAKLHLELLDPDKAIEFANLSLGIGATENNNITRIESKSILGEAKLLQKDTLGAVRYFNEVEFLRSSYFYCKNYTSINRLIDVYKSSNLKKVDSLLFDISPYSMLDVYPKLLAEKGLREISNNKMENAKLLCLEAHEKASKQLSYQYASLACDCLVSVYDDENNLSLKSEYLSRKIDHQAKLQDEKRVVSLARNLAGFETEKEKALLTQAHEKDQQIMTERVDKYKLASLLGLIILTFGGIALWQLRKRNRKIADQNKQISKALTEKDILLKEIHHRVKNNLQLVSSMLTLQGRSIDDEMAVRAINEGKSRIRSMALIHQDLYNKDSIAGVGVADYLSRLTQELFTTYNIDSDRITLNTDIQDMELDIDTLIPLGLIINELFSNSLKYAFTHNKEGELSISLREHNDQMILTIKDNGVGFNPDKVRENSFGTTLISALTDQLEGEMEVNVDNGTEVVIRFNDYNVVRD